MNQEITHRFAYHPPKNEAAIARSILGVTDE
jgi:hypothetical protein